MPPVLRILKLAAGALVAALAVWFEAVRRTPEVRTRKRSRRERNRRGAGP